MRIVYFIDHLRHDGTQRVLRQLVEGLAARGHDQAVVCLDNSWDDELVRALQAARASVRVVGRIALVGGYGLLATWRWLCRERFDVAVTLLFIADAFGRPLARAAGVPRIVSSIRARNTNYSWWKRFVVRQTMRWADAVVINSTTVRDFAIMQEGARPERIAFVPNGVQIDAYRESVGRAALRAEFGLSRDQCLIGSVGRLSHQKGLDLLLDALGRLPRDDIALVLFGRGEQEQQLRAQAAALGLSGRVHFAGYRQDVPDLLGALDLYIHPARWEGMPNALLEAMAAGCPIVASAVDGVCELIQDTIEGWLVPPENSEALAGAIQAALADPLEARRRATAAQKRATARFGVDAMVLAWEQILS